MVSINQNYIFRRVYAKGRHFASPILVTYVMRNREGCCRVGITASKKIGKAVKRNRARRIIKAAIKDLLPNISGGWDIIFVARNRTVKVKSYDVKKSMEEHLKSACVLK